MPGNTSPGTKAAIKPKKKRRGLKFLFLLILLLAGGGVWASFEYMRSGEVLIPMPDEMSKFISDNLVPGGRLGPVRFGDHVNITDQPAPEVAQNVKPEATALPPGSPPEVAESRELGWGPGAADIPGPEETGPAAGVNPDTHQNVEEPPMLAETEPARPPVPPRAETPDAIPQPVAGGKVTPPDTGWRDEAAIPYEEIRETLPEQEEPATRRQPSRHDVAVFEAPDQSAPPMGPDAGSSLVVAFDSSAEQRPTALMPVNLSSEPSSTEGAERRPKVYSGEDAVVSIDFVGDLATYLAASYWPAGTHPSAAGKDISTASLRSINQRYGIDLHGFSAGTGAVRDYNRDRELILNYVFMPSMIQALTNLYTDRFVDALAGIETVTDARGGTRRLNKAQRVAMLEYYSAEARALSNAINAYAASPDAATRVNAYIRSEQEAQSANARYLDAKQALEIATELKDQAGAQEAARDVARLEAAYRRSMERQRNAESAVRNMMNKGAAGRLGGADLVYAACWLNRRAASGEAVKAAASSTLFVSRVLAERADGLRSE